MGKQKTEKQKEQLKRRRDKRKHDQKEKNNEQTKEVKLILMAIKQSSSSYTN